MLLLGPQKGNKAPRLLTLLQNLRLALRSVSPAQLQWKVFMFYTEIMLMQAELNPHCQKTLPATYFHIYFFSISTTLQGWTWPKMGSVLFAAVFIALHFATGGLANPDAKRLYDDLLSNYNRLIRPVGNNSDRLTVKMGLRLSQLIDVVSAGYI